MATLVLATAGAAVGGALMPAGIGLFGATLSGAVVGRAVGAMAGRYIDQALFGASGQTRIVDNTGSRLSDLQVTSSSEGVPVPRIFGRVRLGGQVIWATDFEEEVVREKASIGGKGMGGSTKSTTVTLNYVYYANFAVALCEGEISRLGRVWADGSEINLSGYTYRVYNGSETQQPDSLIEAKQGAGNTPAYRGIAYIVFERMPLEAFGNRIPQLNFEVYRALDDVEKKITGVTMIPATGEFAYEVEPVERDAGQGQTVSENVHHQMGGSDWTLSLDQMQDMLPNCRSVSLFVGWFGTDLRAASCEVKPGVDTREKNTRPYDWRVAGLERSNAHLISRVDERAAYGGTPADRAVLAAIDDLKARGLRVTFNPFLLLDVPTDNSLPDPYGEASQSAYPWRGRITCDPAPGQTGSPDQTSTAAVQIASFVGTCEVADFDISTGEVVYSGLAEWSWRRMVLHYAHLCVLAGGVDAFLLGSELRGLTQVRDGAASYPFVAALVQLAADVRQVLGPSVRISYAADWSEYFGHQPADGSGDVYFHLDPLWASDDVDAVAIDCYWPLSDWRDDEAHLDAAAGVLSIYDLSYLKGNLAGGEGYDWYYASDADRDGQIRTPITDGSGKPWLFRYKDLGNWWANPHYDRPNGVEDATPTGWVPQGKPFWLMEVGCPAIDKGANQPNVFFDDKSAESAMPHYSRGHRDDTMQRRYLQAFYESFDPEDETFDAVLNPMSDVYGGRMVDPGMIHAYTWDARPYPAFPFDEETWSDGGNWERGHWLNGRMAGGPLRAVIDGILDAYNFEKGDASGVEGMMEGYILDDVMSARDALQPLEMAFFVDSLESDGKIRFVHKGQRGVRMTLDRDALVETGKNADLYTLTRGQETDLPRSAKITYIDGVVDYRQAVVEARRHVGATSRVATAQLPIVLGQAQAQSIADSWLHDVWSGREEAAFALPPSMLAVEPGDMVRLETELRSIDLRVTGTTIAEQIAIEAITLQPHIYRTNMAPVRSTTPGTGKLFGPSIAAFLDLPLLWGSEDSANGYLAAYQSPWPGGVNFFRSAGESGYTLAASCTRPAMLGETLSDFSAGPSSRWDFGNSLTVALYDGSLVSRERLDVLSGSNLIAVELPTGAWELVQFQKAQLIDTHTYRLSGFLRGLGGSEAEMVELLPAGARLVVLDQAVTTLALASDEVGLAYNWKVGPACYDIGHRSYRTCQHSFQGVGGKPLAPAHLEAKRDTDGVVVFNWIRRTRQGGDSWEALEVPLAEQTESYEVDILSSGEVVRTLKAESPAALYDTAQQVEDFGDIVSKCAIAVYQLSATRGRGYGAVAVFQF